MKSVGRVVVSRPNKITVSDRGTLEGLTQFRFTILFRTVRNSLILKGDVGVVDRAGLKSVAHDSLRRRSPELQIRLVARPRNQQ